MLHQFTAEDADRLCGLGDRFIENWEADEDDRHDDDLVERRAEWNAIRPLFVAAPELLAALKSGQLESWVCNAALTGDIEALRAICVEWSHWWNNVAWPALVAAGVTEVDLPTV